MTVSSSFSVSYDRCGDVLYIVRTREPATKGVEDDNGILWRYASNGSLIGATILDFLDSWSDKEQVLANELSQHFHIAHSQAIGMVEKALESGR